MASLDLGDVIVSLNVAVKGFKAPTFRWRIGPASDTTAAERVSGEPPTYKQPPGKVDVYMDLKADQKVSFALQATDEVGNPTEFAGTTVFTVDDPSIVTLTDNGDGTGEVAATGVLGVATLTGTATRDSDGAEFTGVAAIQVVAGDAETFEITFGTPEEVTPDTEPEPTP